jgi:predicted RNase H-like HicB family nuclease
MLPPHERPDLSPGWRAIVSDRQVSEAMKVKVAIYPSEEGFSVSVPGLPGCWSQGATEAEALANIVEAIREYLEAEIEPTNGAIIRYVEVA